MLSRSVTPSPTTPTRSRLGLPTRLVKSNSSSNIDDIRMAAAAAAAAASTAATPPHQTISAMREVMRDDHVMDTRTPSPILRVPSNSSPSGSYQPDLSAEVAMLSTKLVNAINYQTTLDDSLQQARHELEHSRRHCQALLAEKQQWDSSIANGVLMKKAEVDQTIAQLRAELASERAAREEAEKAKRQTEGELENLTSALFEEANTMVAAARKDTEAMERRNTQLRAQLNDTELLLASQQEQLQDLKIAMEKLQSESPPTRDPSVPSTPVASVAAGFDPFQLSPTSTSNTDTVPQHPLHYTHLLAPALRTDTIAFTEFQDLLQTKKALAHSRTNSSNANTNGFNNAASASSSGSLGALTTSPNVPSTFSFSTNSSPSSATFSIASNSPPLKESKFYKRALTEDIEPTLRLDAAPGLTFLSRRSVFSALLQGTLAVEPFPTSKHYYACALCGEARATEIYKRNHRFRTSEDDQVSKPLCDYCLNRLRATCDFIGFLRMVRDGFWKSDSEAEQKIAWEESVKLRERMFWTRIGGGVFPHHHQTVRNVPSTPSTQGPKSGRPSLDSIPEAGEHPKTISTSSFGQKLPESSLVDKEDSHDDQSRESSGPVAREPVLSSGRELKFTTPPPIHDNESYSSPERTTDVSSPVSNPQPSADNSLSARKTGGDDLQKDLSNSTETAELTSPELAPAPGRPPEPSPRLLSPMPESAPNTLESPAVPGRRVSSVLARVRAMEAAGQEAKPPGSFD